MFGGVAMGSMNANDAPRVTGNPSKYGFVSVVVATPSIIGIRMLEVAVFDVISVK